MRGKHVQLYWISDDIQWYPDAFVGASIGFNQASFIAG